MVVCRYVCRITELLHNATQYSILQYINANYSILQYINANYSILQYINANYSILQYVIVY